MAGTTFTIKLTRGANQPWGFRLQGGKDFSTPLSIQKVTNDSLAEKAGLQAGDAILKINDLSTEQLRHKEAQDAVVRAGNHFELTVQRGGVKIWKPSVTPLSDLKTGPRQPIPTNEPKLVTKTSLAANKQEVRPIGSTHNVKAKPFGGSQVNGDTVTALVHKQYNSPAGLYSMQNIADTLSQQAEVLSTGAVGFNFMKNNPPVNKDSAVYRMVVEEETTVPEKVEPEEQFRGTSTTQDVQSRSFKVLQMSLENGEESATRMAALRHVEAPKVAPPSESSDTTKSQENLCAECGRLIVGVFVRIKDKSLHADCFKCTTCGASLRNVGYYNINNKLYCDVHARQVARHHAPSTNLVPITIPPGGNLPKESIVGYASSGAPFTSVGGGALSPGSQPSYGTPTSAGNPPFQASKQSATTPISVAVDTSYKHPHTAPYADAHKPVTAAPVGPASPGTSAWIPTSPVGATTKPQLSKPMHTAPTAGSRPAPRRGRGILNPSVAPGTRIPICAVCGTPIRGPFVTALGKTWCAEHFHCVNPQCRRPLQDIGFVEEQGQLYCENCYETYLAPVCAKCLARIKGDCLNAIGKQWHPDCFICANCRQPFGNSHFYLEDGLPYCEKDWNELFTTKCVGCGYPIEAGDRWVEALNSNYHSQCFKCTICHKNLEGQSFYAKGGRPFCKTHAR